MADRQHVLVRHLISRPNPIEPQSAPHRHPLNGTPQLAKAHRTDFARLLLDEEVYGPGERTAKRRKFEEVKSLDLPKLPVRQGAQRLRIPPTLSGLHQPPPNAGLLPSISTEQPAAPPDQTVTKPADATQAASDLNVAPERASNLQTAVKPGKPKRNRWSDEETAALLKGVARFGIGSWTKVLNCPEYSFNNRTALDLKDRFRVCCPDEYQHTNGSRSRAHGIVGTDGKASIKKGAAGKAKKTTDKPYIGLEELGINQPFRQNKRRKRHGYSVEEDEAILGGFRKYGNAWAAIRADDSLHLEHRTATDLRDRMRTKYPDEYAKAGLAPRPEVFPKPPERGKDPVTDQSTSTGRPPEGPSENAVPAEEKECRVSQKQTSAKALQKPSLLPYDNDSVFWGAPFHEDDLDCEPITLDRGILDWPGGSTKQIDSLVSLRLPEPTAAPLPFHSTSHGMSGSALPSVAAITSGSQQGMDDQLELPSLMIGALEPDGRAGGHFLGFDELLS